MNINLREEETREYISLYQSYLEEIQVLNHKVTDVLNEIMLQSRYDRLQQQISRIIDVYTETIVNNGESGVFAVWEESEGSLRSCLRTYKAGNAADEICAQIERQMGDLMQDILKIDKADVIVTERPIVSEDGLEQLEDICRSAQTDIQDIKSNYLHQIINREDENEIYSTLKPLFEGISASLENFFAASLNSFIELREFVRSISLKLQNADIDYETNDMQQPVKDVSCNAVGNNDDKNDDKSSRGFCPMWVFFAKRTDELYRDCDRDQTVSQDEREAIKDYYKKTIWIKIKTELDFQKVLCAEMALKKEYKPHNVVKIHDLCMWRDCPFRDKLVEQTEISYLWPGNEQDWSRMKKNAFARGLSGREAISNDVDYNQIKQFFFSSKKSKGTYVKTNGIINDLLIELRNLRNYREVLSARNKGVIGLINKVLLNDISGQISYVDSLSDRISSILCKQRQLNADSLIGDAIERARGTIVDKTTALDYIRRVFDKCADGIVDENLIRTIVDTMPAPPECTDDIKNQLFNQIVSEKKSYCGIKMRDAKNLDYDYRKKLDERKKSGYSNAVKLFDKFSDQIKLCNDNFDGTAHFTRGGEFGIYFNPHKEQLQKNVGDTFFHEVGHHIDHLLDRVSQSEDFIGGFLQDRKDFIQNYNKARQEFREKFLKNIKQYEYSRLSDLIRGWNIIIENSDDSERGPELRAVECENSLYISKGEAATQGKTYEKIQQEQGLYYKRLEGCFGHAGYDTVPECKIYYDFYMTVNSKFRPWEREERNKYQPEHEAFAEMFEADMAPNGSQPRKLFEQYLPSTWREYRKIVDNYCD